MIKLSYLLFTSPIICDTIKKILLCEVKLMSKILSELTAPVLAGVVREKTAAAAIAEIKNCTYHGAGMIDLHMSCLDDSGEENLRKIITASRLPILALNYNMNSEWKHAGFTEEEREAMFLRAIDAGAAGVDMQGYTFHAESKLRFCGEDKYSFTKNGPKEVVTDEAVIARQRDFIGRIHEKGGEVLLSCHPGIFMNAETVVELALFLEKRDPDIIKIVTVASNEDELIESFRAMVLLKREVKTAVSYHASGKAGALSRIVNPMLGGHMIFCVDRFSQNSTLEQLELSAAKAAVDNIKNMM